MRKNLTPNKSEDMTSIRENEKSDSGRKFVSLSSLQNRSRLAKKESQMSKTQDLTNMVSEQMID